jgi:hypothetical protein
VCESPNQAAYYHAFGVKTGGFISVPVTNRKLNSFTVKVKGKAIPVTGLGSP